MTLHEKKNFIQKQILNEDSKDRPKPQFSTIFLKTKKLAMLYVVVKKNERIIFFLSYYLTIDADFIYLAIYISFKNCTSDVFFWQGKLLLTNMTYNCLLIHRRLFLLP